MAHRSDIPKDLIYTCRCGWVDKGHAIKTSAERLWSAVLNEAGADTQIGGFRGFLVGFAEEEKRLGVVDGTRSRYVVRRGLSVAQKESVALGIFLSVSYDFEDTQATWPHTWVTDSGFSEEDLVSDLLGFYEAVRKVSWKFYCQPVSAEESLKIWDTYGGVGRHKNRSVKPNFYPCAGCKGPAIFPQIFTMIAPARPGELYRKLCGGGYFIQRAR
jgi:hypothetical protein